MITVEICNRQDRPFDEDRIRVAAEVVLESHGVRDASVSVAILDDPSIHQLNRHHLQHDYPTDVLSFLYSAKGTRLEGEIIASAETADREADAAGWSMQEELVLYVVHGCLHLVGFDDHDEADRLTMRGEERRVLELLGIRSDSHVPTPEAR